jgi:hypothetical protein
MEMEGTFALPAQATFQMFSMHPRCRSQRSKSDTANDCVSQKVGKPVLGWLVGLLDVDWEVASGIPNGGTER